MSIVTPLSSRYFYIILGIGLTFIFFALVPFLGLIRETWFGFPKEFSFFIWGCIHLLIGLIGIRKIHGGIIL